MNNISSYISQIIFCEDARAEQNGSPILIGVMSRDVQVVKLPSTLNAPCIYLEIIPEGNKFSDIICAIRTQNNIILSEAKMKFNLMDWNKSAGLTIKLPSTQFKESGTYFISVKAHQDDAWENIKEIRLSSFPNSQPTKNIMTELQALLQKTAHEFLESKKDKKESDN